MTSKLHYKNPVCITVLFFILALPSFVLGETDFAAVLDSDDRSYLDSILEETKGILDKAPNDIESITKRGIAFHNIAHSKVKGVAKECTSFLKKASKKHPDDVLILALLGSCITMKGRDAKEIDKKMRFVNKGAGIIDKAVMKEPDHVIVRMVRGRNSTGLPKLFKRRKFTKIDFLHIDKIVSKSPDALNVATQAQVYYKLGKIFSSEGDKALSQSYYKKTVAVSPDSIWAKRANKRIE